MTRLASYSGGNYSIRLELLEYSYWEHFGMAKSLANILPIDHPKRLRIENELKKIIAEMEEVSKNNL